MRWRGTAAVLAVALWAAFPTTSPAATFAVNEAGDPLPGACTKGHCTLREAIRAANANPGGDVIELPSRKVTYRLQRPGDGEDSASTGDLDITGPVRVLHRGRGRAHVDGARLDRIFDVLPGAPATFKKLLLTGGKTQAGEDGGAIQARAPLTLLNVIARGNRAGDAGGAIYSRDAGLKILNSKLINNRSADGSAAFEALGPTALVKRTLVRGNETPGQGGSSYLSTSARVIASRFIGNSGGNHGGAIYLNDGELVVRRSSFQGNQSGYIGGGIMSFGDLVIDGSTFSSNTAAAGGGGLYLGLGSTLEIVNSTLYSNRTGGSGGGLQAQQATEVRLNSVTIVRNVANTDSAPPSEAGGGVGNSDSFVYVRNSLLALNRLGDGTRNDCGGSLLFSQGNNLVSTYGPASACNGFGASDLLRPDPRVRGLGDYGGPTETVGLRKGSPAIGRAHRGSAPARDQRGRKRDRRPDIGAFER